MEATRAARNAPRLPLPSFLQFDNAEAMGRGLVLSIPNSSHIPFEFNTNQVAEYYAKRGV
jgi:small subunit ribosomal protein S4